MKHEYAELSEGLDFLATRPPPLQSEAEFAGLMSSLGASTLRAVIFDLDTRLCHESWQIDEQGECSNDSNDGGAINHFVTAMGTIAQLSQTSATDTLIRQLNPRRCAFAWRIDERRVAVAEARYLLPQTGPRDLDAVLLREHFSEQMLLHTLGAAGDAPSLPKTAHRRKAEADDYAHGAAHHHLHEKPGAAFGDDVAARWLTTWWGRSLLALILVCLAAAGAFLIADYQVQSLQNEQLRLRDQADATMGRQIADVLAQGDYGEVQAELETFADLGYFRDAVVTNAQRRVIALVGSVPDARIGDPFTADESITVKVVALGGRDQPGLGHLMTWALADVAVEPVVPPRTLLLAAVLLGLLAAAVAAWLLSRSRRQHGRRFGRRSAAET